MPLLDYRAMLGEGMLGEGFSGNPLFRSEAGYAFEDATSGILCPAEAADWVTLGLTAPTSLYSFQQASGDVIDDIGTVDLVDSGSPGYQQSVSGWTRKAITLAQSGAAKFTATISGADTTDFLALFYVAITSTPGGTRQVLEHPNIYAEVNGTPRYIANGGTAVTGGSDPGTTVRPLLIQNWLGTQQRLATDQEILAPNVVGLAGTTFTVGSSTSTGAPMAVLYGAIWEGVTARMSNATIKSMLQALGWTIPW